MFDLDTLAKLPLETHVELFGSTTLYRAYSLVNAEQQPETDLFAGIGGA